jgi:hypothetical protein
MKINIDGEKTLGERYPFSTSNIFGKIILFIKEIFWFLLIGAAVLFFGDLKWFLFYAFFITLYCIFYLTDPDGWRRDEVQDRFLQILEMDHKLNIIAYKSGVKVEDIRKYLMSKLKEGNYTKEAEKKLRVILEIFSDEMTALEKYKEEK